MERLKELCKEYIDDHKYVFKSCGEYIVVLEKLLDTITNEFRSNISDPMYAKYRANKLKVILIINKFDPFDIIKDIRNTYYKDSRIKYETDKIVEVNDYNMNLDKVCTTGIHYFKTIEQTFYWDIIDFNLSYTGKYIYWHDNGFKFREGEFFDGKKIGKWIRLFENGNKREEGGFLDGKMVGKWIEWYENGNKKYEGKYIDGKQVGKWIYWFSNGNKEEEGEYLDGEETGKWIIWYENGNKKEEIEYLDGRFVGKFIRWWSNGTIQFEQEYLKIE